MVANQSIIQFLLCSRRTSDEQNENWSLNNDCLTGHFFIRDTKSQAIFEFLSEVRKTTWSKQPRHQSVSSGVWVLHKNHSRKGKTGRKSERTDDANDDGKGWTTRTTHVTADIPERMDGILIVRLLKRTFPRFSLLLLHLRGSSLRILPLSQAFAVWKVFCGGDLESCRELSPFLRRHEFNDDQDVIVLKVTTKWDV